MKKLIASFFTALIIFSMSIPVLGEEEPKIESGSAVIIDANSGQILFDKDMNEKKYPASITKILTIYLGSTIDFGKTLTASSSAIDSVPRDTSNIALDYGEELSVKDALYAAQLMSANDASNVIAEGVSGTIADFVNLMNQTAEKFGAKNTHFSNANGLFDKENYTTSYDMALITKNALESEKFSKIFCSTQYTIDVTNKKTEKRNFVAQHRMVYWGQYSHLNVKGGKSGYTSESGHTLVTYGKKNGIDVIIVVMDSPNFSTVYSDTEKLLEYAYENFEYQTVEALNVPEKIEGRITYTPKKDVTFLLKKDLTLENVKYEYTKDAIILRAPDGKVLSNMEVEVVEKETFIKRTLKVILIILGAVVFLGVFGFVLLFINENRNRRRRRKKREYIKNNMKETNKRHIY